MAYRSVQTFRYAPASATAYSPSFPGNADAAPNVVIFADCTSGQVTINLPLITAANRGQMIWIGKLDAGSNNVVIATANSTQYVVLGSQKTASYQTNAAGFSVTLISDGVSIWKAW